MCFGYSDLDNLNNWIHTHSDYIIITIYLSLVGVGEKIKTRYITARVDEYLFGFYNGDNDRSRVTVMSSWVWV